MRVGVIGGAGYIGSHVALALCDAGHEVIVLDSLRTGKKAHLRNIEHTLVKGDVRERSDLDRFFSHELDAIIHLAALKSVGASMHDPYAYSDVNIHGTLMLLDAMHDYSVDRFVFSSSAAVYGTPQKLPIDESHPLAPESYYGQTKAWIEGVLDWYAKLNGLSAVSLRYFNAVGCDPDGRVLVREPEPENLFPIILETALGERDAITIFGTDYDTPDGTCVRDYIHVSDLADAHVRALELEGGHTALNLGTGAGLSVRECVDAARELFGEFAVNEGPRREGDPASSYADASKARAVLDWTAKHTNVKQMFVSMAPSYGLEVDR